MSKDTLTISGRQYHLTPEQAAMVEEAVKERDEAFDRIKRDEAGKRHDYLSNANDPYREPILRYQRRLCEIVGLTV